MTLLTVCRLPTDEWRPPSARCPSTQSAKPRHMTQQMAPQSKTCRPLQNPSVVHIGSLRASCLTCLTATQSTCSFRVQQSSPLFSYRATGLPPGVNGERPSRPPARSFVRSQTDGLGRLSVRMPHNQHNQLNKKVPSHSSVPLTLVDMTRKPTQLPRNRTLDFCLAYTQNHIEQLDNASSPLQ